jgi:hypothetical protein
MSACLGHIRPAWASRGLPCRVRLLGPTGSYSAYLGLTWAVSAYLVWACWACLGLVWARQFYGAGNCSPIISQQPGCRAHRAHRPPGNRFRAHDRRRFLAAHVNECCKALPRQRTGGPCVLSLRYDDSLLRLVANSKVLLASKEHLRQTWLPVVGRSSDVRSSRSLDAHGRCMYRYSL